MFLRAGHKVIDAFIAGQKAKHGVTHTDGQTLYLYGNEIAWRKGKSIYISSGGIRMTVSTRERLNVIPGVNVSMAGGETTLNGKPWDGRKTKVA
jgi:hypothetical protein